jgi:hypothetical protein
VQQLISTRNKVQIKIANAMKKVDNSTPGTLERAKPGRAAQRTPEFI